jgi:hypothetical protein
MSNMFDLDNDGTRTIEPAGMLAGVSRIEIEAQVAVARKYPRFHPRRTIEDFQNELVALGSVDPESAGSCFYCLLRKTREGKVVKIEGISIRGAELVAYGWHNLYIATRISEIGEESLTAVGFGWDVESNERLGVETRRRITTSQGRRYGEDMIQVTTAAAQSICYRNVILRLVPPALIKAPFEKIKAASAGPADVDLAKRQQRALKRFEEIGAPPEQVLKVLGRKHASDITLEDLAELAGILTAIKSGEIASWREYYQTWIQQQTEHNSEPPIDPLPPPPKPEIKP